MNAVLDRFHPLAAAWFREEVGAPTSVQEAAWPRIAEGDHALITAPTGSGKTLTAFLWALDQLLTGRWSGGQTRVLYVSPLKALNNDIERNLLGPLAALRTRFREAGERASGVTVKTRSGDTPQSERRRMMTHPPEILITTPESLNLMVNSKHAKRVFGGLRTVILDEIHAVAAGKRGTHLITAVDRLVPLAGEFQRIALSATVRPVERIAEWVGGYMRFGPAEAPVYEPRPVRVVEAPEAKEIAVGVRFAGRSENVAGQGTVWPALVEAFREIIARNRSTLIFTNSRRLAERLALFINEAEGAVIAYAHHGSLSREFRATVEQRLKDGELSAIVATNSLELGIDVGALDQALLVQTPFSVASALQRIGRAGHQVGAVSRAALFPTHGRDFLESAVLARAVLDRDIEPLRPIEQPLDVLAQVLVAMASGTVWDVEELYAAIRTSTPYRGLSRRLFDAVLDMLAGRYNDARVRPLQPLVHWDRVDHTVEATKAGARTVFSAGGTIADRGYYQMKRVDSAAVLGELDEEFVWERRIGDTFSMGTQSWRIEQISYSDVRVSPSPPRKTDVPFWRAESLTRGFHFSERLLEFLEWADGVSEDDLRAALLERHAMTESAADELVGFIARQKSATGAPLPHRRHLLVECVAESPEEPEARQLILHTCWGGALNRPYALALGQAWEETYRHRIEVFCNDDCVSLVGVEPVDPQVFAALVSPENVDRLIRLRLEQSGFFGARFRENAATALQLPRAGFGKRTPLWLNRLRAKKLLDSVKGFEDFPVVIETWRTCLNDFFDVPRLKTMLAELHDGSIATSAVETLMPSPMAESLAWRQTNYYMYLDDAPSGAGPSQLTPDALAEVMRSDDLRPDIERSLIEAFEAKAQRLAGGYAPTEPRELLEWVKERLLAPWTEWERLLQAVEREAETPAGEMVASIEDKLLRLAWGGDAYVAAAEAAPRLARALPAPDESAGLDGADYEWPESGEDEGDELPAVLSEVLRFWGPIPLSRLSGLMPAPPEALDAAVAELRREDQVILGRISAGAEAQEVCDAENLEILLRLRRRRARPSEAPRPVADLPLFIAERQGLCSSEAPELEGVIAPLLGYPIPAGFLEEEVLPARMEPYAPAELDRVLASTELEWFGVGEKRIALGFPEHRELLAESGGDEEDAAAESRAEEVFPDPQGRYPFTALLTHTGGSSADVARDLWDLVWLGKASNDSYEALRRGVQTKFKPPAAEKPRGRRPPRGNFSRWKAARPVAGNWRRLPPPASPEDLVAERERDKDRVRQLLERYGVLFRDLLKNEAPPMQWGRLFRALRTMELSGELVSGEFFQGVAGLQFAAAEELAVVRGRLPEDAIYWMNAADPASLCGVAPGGLREDLPRRMASSHLVYHGTRLVAVSERSGKSLYVRVAPEAVDPRYWDFLRTRLTRAVRSESSVRVEEINGESARSSPYLDALRRSFEAEPGLKGVTLRHKRG